MNLKKLRPSPISNSKPFETPSKAADVERLIDIFHSFRSFPKNLQFRIRTCSPKYLVDLRSGLTLVEVMIALTVTLIILGAMMTAFQSVSQGMQKGRAVIELSNRLRSVENSLRSDLEGVTVQTRPYTNSIPPGFLQIVEGPRRDGTLAGTANNVYGDIDDVISMTVQSANNFRGQINIPGTVKTAIESPLAEVIWFTTWDPPQPNPTFVQSVDLRRKVMLLVPPSMQVFFPNFPVLASNLTWDQVRTFFQFNDISARIEPTAANQFTIVANTLQDLAVRKNRFGHAPAFSDGNLLADGRPIINLDPASSVAQSQGFPNKLHIDLLAQFTTERDIVMTDLVAFDIKVYSPNSLVRRDPSGMTTLEPHEVGFSAGVDFGPYGGFVDLGYAQGPVGTWFLGPPHNLSFLNGAISSWPGGGVENTFDTWTPEYESDGINQDVTLGDWRAREVDSFVNGFDDDLVNGVDDVGERETMPPYPHAIRGIEIQIRAAEKLTKQVQQITIRHNFVPE